MPRRSPLPWLLMLLVALAATWFWVAPHRAYDRLVQSIAFGSEAGMAESIDFPVLRTHLRDDLTAAIARRSRSRIGGAIAATLVDQAVDVTLTPGGLANLITAFGTRTPGPGAADTLVAGTDVSFRYHDLSRVDVHVRPKGDSDANAGILTFSREGTSWRLTRIWSEQLLGKNGAP